MALADVDPPTDALPAPVAPGAAGRRDAAAAALRLAAPPARASARDAELRRAARARQAVVARWLRQLSS